VLVSIETASAEKGISRLRKISILRGSGERVTISVPFSQAVKKRFSSASVQKGLSASIGVSVGWENS